MEEEQLHGYLVLCELVGGNCDACNHPEFASDAIAPRLGLVAKSSNYELYGEMSARAMKLLARYSAWVEVYSIDEAFLGVRGTHEELQTLGETIKSEVMRLTGLPVCMGIARTTGTAEYS